MRTPLILIFVSLVGCSSSPLRGQRNSFLFDWPVDKARLTQKFKTGFRKHHGVDLAAPRGTSIYASENGRVSYTGSGLSGYGKLIIIDHGKTWKTYYSHLDKFHVKEGEWVEQGELIAAMGRTGRATGTHLHFEIRKNKNPVDPLPYLP